MTKDELHGTNKEQDNKPKTEQKTGGATTGAGGATTGAGGTATGAGSAASAARPATPMFAPRGPSLTPPAPAPRGMHMMQPMMPQARNLAPVTKPALQPVATAPKKPADETDDNG